MGLAGDVSVKAEVLRLASLSHISRNLKPDETCGIRSFVLDLVWFH